MSRRRVVTTTRADEDVESVVDHYREVANPGTASTFIDALESAKNLIAEYPSIGSPRLSVELGIPGLRAISTRGFPYLLIYTEDTDAMRVHRVLHTRRDVVSELLSDEIGEQPRGS